MPTSNSLPEHLTGGPRNPVAWWGTIAGVCLVILAGSFFVTRAYRAKLRHEIENPRPYFAGKLASDLRAVNRDGQPVALSQLNGKIFVAGYQYTSCPSGCLGMAAFMILLHDKFGERDDFQLVSISVDPAEDTPEKMDAWVRDHGVDEKNWWFLTGDGQRIRDYMIREFKFFGTRENTDPATIASEGKFAHDQRLCLVDRDRNIRGYYDVMNPRHGNSEIDRLVRDIEYLFREQPAPAAAGNP
ncbi:MAG: SCO family protein [Verrucomicrobiae bacterium]|nr:SCO family protein [Verrucomicrobiae bacterium]MCP5540129.1 SCO family protein [Akkermansiaceae bacterium]